MELTQREVRYLQRYRTGWHRAFRIVRNILALASVAIVVLFFVKAYLAVQDIHAYETKLQNLRASVPDASAAVNPAGDLPTYVIPATAYATVHDAVLGQMALYDQALDSLGLSPDILGFTFYVEVLPVGVENFRSCFSRMNTFTNCGCDKDGVYGFQILEVDSAVTHARVVSSQDKTTIAEFKTLNRQPSGPRR